MNGLMTTLLATLLLLCGMALLVPSFYLLLLTVASLFYQSPSRRNHSPKHRFAILVPAHDEETLLPGLLKSLEELDYPPSLRRVYVVADNCSDNTAAVAADYECVVHERSDPEFRSKGYALQWLLERIASSGDAFDAYVFLDADCVASRNFLTVADTQLQLGHKAVQAYDGAANPTESWVSSLRYIALVLRHHARSRGREVLGLSCGLFGTGMVFHRSIIETYGWHTHGLVEDVEYYLHLTKHGIRVNFAPEATVLSGMPASLRDARSQNERWEKGRLEVAKRHVPSLVWQSLNTRSAMKLDAAIEQAIPPLSIVVLASVVLFGASLAMGGPVHIVIAAAVLAALLGHVTIGLTSARPPAAVLLSVAYAPCFILWKLLLYARVMLTGSRDWVRTRRD